MSLHSWGRRKAHIRIDTRTRRGRKPESCWAREVEDVQCRSSRLSCCCNDPSNWRNRGSIIISLLALAAVDDASPPTTQARTIQSEMKFIGHIPPLAGLRVRMRRHGHEIEPVPWRSRLATQFVEHEDVRVCLSNVPHLRAVTETPVLVATASPAYA
ncbi:hypothetical protein OH76DRAFT_506831 [Lentinus brumalis]|uniref:Uncharacterized protein n=1 Tax=Lentinus brumalis TaxID=2498619 RepID=A0A371DAY8_9APHY|nr:hypothetical protein OH76DRAFT_506831 [Polyporus brumalis]